MLNPQLKEEESNMKQKHNKILLTLIGILLLITPVNVNALIWFNGNSGPGNITIIASILIPIPIINLNVTESGETDFFGIAQLTISEYDDNYNTLKINSDLNEPMEIPVPYGSFGVNYLTLSNGFPPLGANQSDIYGYLSVAYNSVVADIKSTVDLTISIEREELIELLTSFTPPEINLGEFIGDGPFEVGLSLEGELSGTATPTSPTISGEFDYSLTLPANIFAVEIPFFEIPIPEELQGKISVAASFGWDNWSFFSPFSTVNLSITQTFEEEELQLDPITFDFLPVGTCILWLDTGD